MALSQPVAIPSCPPGVEVLRLRQPGTLGFDVPRRTVDTCLILLSALILLVAGRSALAQTGAAAPAALFETKIRPLLLDSCVSCHGKEGAQGGLRLDVAVSPAKATEILRRVKGEGGKPRMPMGGELSKDKIAALEQWVKAGAYWPTAAAAPGPDIMARGKNHWSFQPLTRPPVPAVKAAGWVRNPIDAFVLKRLEARGLKPNPAATRSELIRRVTYDLTGLPPTPEEVRAFETDRDPNAYAKLVDRLLASPHYGEKWGRHWLDLVRYAETNSYERDNPKPNVYKYRDYVIRAFNADKPYDRFVREQIAGDQLPDPTGDALAATAYYRLGIWDDEPADMQQAVYDDLDDLVTTTGQAFLGLTLDCARCHDHKFDPIPQKDYYRFAALFRNINRFRNGGPTDEADYFATPEQKRDYERRVAELDARRKANQAQLDQVANDYRSRRAQIMNPYDLADLHYRYYEGDYATIPNFDALKPAASGPLPTPFVDLKPRKRDASFGFVFEGELVVPQDGDYTFFLDSDDGSRLTVAGKKIVEKNSGGGQGNEMRGTIHLTAGRAPFRIDYFQGGGPFGLNFAWSGPGFSRRALSTLESSSELGLPTLYAAEFPLVLTRDAFARYQKLTAEKADLDKEQVSADKVLCVTETGPKAPDTFVLLRGNPNTPGERIDPGFPLCAHGGPAVVPTPAADARTDGRRLALANWLTSPDNPLTARVIVNRIWQHHFGRGIVRTPSDFGLQGARPTHPELLDWLAKEFIARGWSFKQLHRLILTSNAYKQSSRGNELGLSKDPQNDLFWRFDARRLDAEEIRDSLLAVAGNLNLTLYGPPVYPEIPKEILAGQSQPGADWHTDQMKPEDVNRRSLYIHVKRSLIYPLLASFDLPETDRTNAARFASTQPTQALSMLNGPLVNRQASLLAERVKKEVGDEPRAFALRTLSLVLQRAPTAAEVTESVALMERLQRHGAKPDQARAYLCLMALNLDEFVYVD
jgi:cytochrome c553